VKPVNRFRVTVVDLAERVRVGLGCGKQLGVGRHRE